MSHLPLNFPSDPNYQHPDLSTQDDFQHVPAYNGAPPIGTPSNFTLPDLDEDHSTLWRGVFALGRNMDGFVQRQSEEQQANIAALSAIADRLASTSISPSGGSGVPKFREPRMFNGRADQVDGFLREMENAQFLQRRSLQTDRDKVVYFSFYLSDGSPGSWYHTVELDNAKTGLLDDYTAFVAAFRKHFEQSDQYADALRKLGELKQTGSAAAFTSRFVELVARLDWTDQTKIQSYWDKLKDTVKDTLINRKGRYFTTDFNEFAKECISIDNERHQFDLDRRAAKKSSTTSSSSFSRTPAHHPPLPTPSTSQREPDVVPMEVDAIRRGPLSEQEKTRRRSLGLCLYCGQGKHFAKDCPNKPTKAKTTVAKANPSPGKA